MEIYSCFNPGFAITIDWNRLSLILIPAWPETIDQCAELSSRFNDPTGPLFLFLSPGCLSLLRGKKEGKKKKRLVITSQSSSDTRR